MLAREGGASGQLPTAAPSCPNTSGGRALQPEPPGRLVARPTVLREIARSAAKLMEAKLVGVWVADERARTLELRALSDNRLLAFRVT